jgi:serine/threonine protein kinase
MGEVYEAVDTRLDRTVAVKVLPEHLAMNPEARQRFEREARSVSSLNHPNICTLHDIGYETGVAFLVMERLEGETLQERLGRGPLPTPEVTRTASQIADALDKAHRQGLIHRDLKPGNVMLTKSGAKLLDFGLAKNAAESAGAMTLAPTATSPLTAEGTIIGTFQYMSPEQLEGGDASTRSDVFAFGALLYEMIAGQRAFAGQTQASLVAAILKEAPRPLSAIQRGVPPALERLVETCLEKDPDERRQSMHDVLLELRWIDEGKSASAAERPGAPRRSRETIAWAVAALALFAAVSAFVFVSRTSETSGTPQRYHLSIPPPEGTRFEYRRGAMALSPDGRQVAFVARDESEDETRRLWLRSLEQGLAQPLPGTEDASAPFWSPDSRSIGFHADGKLKRIDPGGGPPRVVCDADRLRGAFWGDDDLIVFAQHSGPLRSIPASGGEPRSVTRVEAGEWSHRHPVRLPDGEHVLYFVRTSLGGSNAVKVGSIHEETSKHLLDADSNAVFARPGHIVFWRDEVLRAQRFDLERLELTGDSFPIAPETRFEPDTNTALFSISNGGVLALHPGQDPTSKSRLALRDREGNELQEVGPLGNFYSPRFSRDGLRVAVDNSGVTNNGDIWVYDVSRSGGLRLTFDIADESDPQWSPDGTRVVFVTSKAETEEDIHIVDVSGAGQPRPLVATELSEAPTDWSTDGRWMAFEASAVWPSQRDIWLYSFENGESRRFLATPFDEYHGQFSPDGRWLAYVSDESGREEVYIRSLPEGSSRWQVSVDGGYGPRWRADGKELFYASRDGNLMSVEVAGGDALTLSTPVALFPIRMRFQFSDHYDVAPDGRRFIVNTALADEGTDPMAILIGWRGDLKR